MGCGKSSVGRKLSQLLCCHFADLDIVIEQQAGKSIPEIFKSDGEVKFRQMERLVLRDIIDQQSNKSKESVETILALGGGAVMQEECERMVHDETFCIYLRASVGTLMEHLSGEASGRPLLNEASSLHSRILELMSLRSSTYERTAHLIIDTDGKSIEDIAEEIISSI